MIEVNIYYYVIIHYGYFQMNGITQDEWVEVAKREIKKHTDREIRFRNKAKLVINGGIQI